MDVCIVGVDVYLKDCLHINNNTSIYIYIQFKIYIYNCMHDGGQKKMAIKWNI